MLLNVTVFMWYGAVCPWHKFVNNDAIPVYRLVPLGIMVLLFRRLPMVLSYHWFHLIPQIEDIKHALFVGFFGPIGVSAIFYLYISREFLKRSHEDERTDLQHLSEAIEVVVWFLVICSIVVHGLSIPLGKLGFYLPRTISTAISSERSSAPQSRAASQTRDGVVRHPDQSTASRNGGESPLAPAYSISWIPRSFVRIGRHILNDIRHIGRGNLDMANTARDEKDEALSRNMNGDAHPEISGPTDARPLGRAISNGAMNVEIDDTDARNAEEGHGLSTGEHVRWTHVGAGGSAPAGTRSLRSIHFANVSATSQPATPRSRRSKDET